MTDGWPCWAIGNHDVARVISRWGNGGNPAAQMKMLNTLLMSLRGSVCSYQGEELGLAEADIAFEDLQDPYGIAFWPNFKGRDGCRTPMPWLVSKEHGGFSSAEATWLPVSTEHIKNSVEQQMLNSDSVLKAYQAFIAWRKKQPCLLYGDIEFIDANNPNTLVFIRRYQGNAILACFNFSQEQQSVQLPNSASLTSLTGYGDKPDTLSDNELSPYQIRFFNVQ